MEPMIYGAQVPYMPKEQARIIRAGLSLFELRTKDTSFFNKTIMGPYGVSVSEFVEQGRPSRAQINWKTGFDTAIIYDADSDGNAVAWMVDDPWWHNRIHLMLDPWMNPVNRHTPGGIIPGFMCITELRAMSNVLRTKVNPFEVFVNGRYKDHFYTKEEAEQFIKDKGTFAIKMDSDGIKNVPTNKNKYDIRPGLLTEYKPEIKQLIDEAKGLQYGWTSSERFRTHWRPLILKETENLKAKNAPKGGGATPEDIAKAMSNWSPDDRAKFASMMMQPASIPEAPREEDNVPTSNFSEAQLQVMKKAALESLLGAEAEGLTRPEMIELILSKQKVTPSAVVVE
jgi:hypothetical protein